MRHANLYTARPMEIRSTVSLRVGSAWRLGDGSVTCAGAAAAEIVLLDLGGTTEEIAGAIGPRSPAMLLPEASAAALICWCSAASTRPGAMTGRAATAEDFAINRCPR
jgi:hypothetical protein